MNPNPTYNDYIHLADAPYGSTFLFSYYSTTYEGMKVYPWAGTETAKLLEWQDYLIVVLSVLGPSSPKRRVFGHTAPHPDDVIPALDTRLTAPYPPDPKGNPDKRNVFTFHTNPPNIPRKYPPHIGVGCFFSTFNRDTPVLLIAPRPDQLPTPRPYRTNPLL